MLLPFRRRRILDPSSDGSGIVTEWLIPYDAGAEDDEDALVRHFRRLSRFDPVTITQLMSSRWGSLFVGRVRIKSGSIDINSLGSFDDIVPAKPGPLPDEEYEQEMFGHSPLLLRVVRRLKEG
jgi:hypothetical protein